MGTELLLPDEMTCAETAASNVGGFPTYRLMEKAAKAVADVFLSRAPDAAGIDVLCGPGNNGGDGYLTAHLLRQAGCLVKVWASAAPVAQSDGAIARSVWGDDVRPLSEFNPLRERLIVDAIFGTGLSKPLEGAALEAVRRCNAASATVFSVDLPTGVSGSSGQILGDAVSARCTITFFRRKPGHLLHPGRRRCGEVLVADIGISDRFATELQVRTFANSPDMWRHLLPRLDVDTHKYARGHVAVLSGPPSMTGAARLAASGAARIGAGAVTVLSSPAAMLVNAAHLTSTMVRRVEGPDDVCAFIRERKVRAALVGPGFGVGPTARNMAGALFSPANDLAAIVLDADALTSFAEAPSALIERDPSVPLVLTPHEGEFRRLFPDIEEVRLPSKIERARAAAGRSGAIVVYKGPDTVIAAPDGRCAVNENGTPLLATAGSGDVLAGIIAGLTAQAMPPWEAACAAVWLHAQAARDFGAGLIAEDLPLYAAKVMHELIDPTD